MPTVPNPPRSRSRWYGSGYAQGEYAARVNLDVDEAGLRKYAARCDLGAYAGEVREGEAQYEGDISYEVGRRGGPTEAQYEKWEEGYYDGFRDKLKEHGIVDRDEMIEPGSLFDPTVP